jgi:signal transduction histidine kinase/ActR/RegA family two-component response regulator
MDAGRHRYQAPRLTLVRSHAASARHGVAWDGSLARESDAGSRTPSPYGPDTSSSRHTVHAVFALLVTAVVAVFQLATWPLLEASPFLLFCAGAVIAACVAGFEGGVITTLSSALVAQYFFITPHRFVPGDPRGALSLAGYIATGFLISLLIARLDRDRAQMARVLDSVSDGFVSVDRDGRCRYANEAAALLEGRSREELVGEPFDLVPGVPLDRAGLRDDEPARVEAYVASLERWIEVTSYPAEDGTTRLYRDVTARHEFDEAIQRAHDSEREARTIAESASRAKDEFLAMISHELRAPLTSILGWLRLLQAGTMDEKETPRALDTIERNATALSRLVGDMLDVSRLVSGKLELDRRLLDPDAALRAAADAVRPLAQGKQIEIVVETHGASPVFGDAARLHQILWNLLANAVKFTPQGGRVDATLGGDRGNVVFTITDNGIGIRSEFLPHVFDRFSQHDSSYSRRFTGLGLGLAIAHHLTEMHGGSVEAKSAGEGQGATFVVRIPRASREESPYRPEAVPHFGNGSKRSPLESHPGPSHDPDAESGPERLDRLPSLQGLRVLVVDDEDDARALVVEILTRRGASVRACPSAVEGRALFTQWKPDVLVSDIGLPEESGYSLIRSIRALGKEGGGDVPAIALTGYARLANRVEALSAGYDLHVPKPVEPSELVLMVASVSGRLHEGPLGHPRPYRP